MSAVPEKRTIAIVTACMCADGSPDFALTEVAVTPEEAENGMHYFLAEEQLLKRDYEEPFVHFDQHEGPAFLHPAVHKYLELLAQAEGLTIPIILEDIRCPV
jgi:hypothetical protein